MRSWSLLRVLCSRVALTCYDHGTLLGFVCDRLLSSCQPMMGMMWEGLLSRGERSKTVNAANMRRANDLRARENLLGSERGGNLINISVPWLIIIINIRNIFINDNLRRRKACGIKEGEETRSISQSGSTRSHEIARATLPLHLLPSLLSRKLSRGSS